ncbi:MAG: AsnC family transcriptional regulator [candidate division NC10 bacterium]|nr:AsnC family transcriptional regulator [candidate division NC10 bacterium]
MDDQDKRLLNAIQADFPLASRPFQALGASLALSEGEVIDRIASLKQQKVVRQISAIFDTRSLGYKSSLVAMRVQPDRLAVPPSSDLQWTVERLHTMTGADSTRILPTLRLFKIGVQLDMEGKSGAEREEPREAGYSDVRRPAAGPAGLRGVDIAAIHELQGDFPLVPEPYRPMADRMGLSEESPFEVARHLQGQGYLRRVAAVLHHREAGFRANAMGVWVVPPQRAEEVGKIMGSFRGVSHCYLRPTYPDWLYNIFTMVHGQKAKDCQEIISAISAATGITEYALLYSTKEYKKVRLKYFTPELDEWEAQARQSAGAAPLDHGMLAANPR